MDTYRLFTLVILTIIATGIIMAVASPDDAMAQQVTLDDAITSNSSTRFIEYRTNVTGAMASDAGTVQPEGYQEPLGEWGITKAIKVIYNFARLLVSGLLFKVGETYSGVVGVLSWIYTLWVAYLVIMVWLELDAIFRRKKNP